MEGFIKGTYDDITFYKMKGKYYARKKSSLTGNKFRRHKAFAGSRRSCGRFGRGNQLASMVYNEIAEKERQYDLYCRMKREAIAMLKAVKTEAEVIEWLRRLKPKTEAESNVSKRKVSLIAASYNKELFRPLHHGFPISFIRRDRRKTRERRVLKFSQKLKRLGVREPDG